VDVAHLFQPLAPGQVRGIAWTAPILARLHELDQLEDAQLVAQKISAMFAGFLTDLNNAGGQQPFEGEQSGSLLTSGLEPGTLKILPAGFDIKFATPREATDAIEFLRLQLRAVAAGLGVPDYLVSGDLSQANYSSLRAGLVEFRRRVEALQFTVIVHQLCRPIWERFVVTAVLSGAIEAPDFEARLDDYLACEWFPPAQDWVDPQKDVKAETEAIAAGLKSRRQAVAERGYDIEQLDAEIAADRARETALNLRFGANPPATPAAETPNAA
jgi:lambda family phage portal protein